MEEVMDIGARRALELGHGAAGEDAAAAEHERAVRDRAQRVELVGDHDDRHAEDVAELAQGLVEARGDEPFKDLTDFAPVLVPLGALKDGKHTWASIASSPAHAIFVYDAEGNEGGRARLLCGGWIVSVNGFEFEGCWTDFRVLDSVNPSLPINVLVLSKHLF
jgi:hypothetical protein